MKNEMSLEPTTTIAEVRIQLEKMKKDAEDQLCSSTLKEEEVEYFTEFCHSITEYIDTFNEIVECAMYNKIRYS